MEPALRPAACTTLFEVAAQKRKRTIYNLLALLLETE
jgi:hypothetical protein